MFYIHSHISFSLLNSWNEQFSSGRWSFPQHIFTPASCLYLYNVHYFSASLSQSRPFPQQLLFSLCCSETKAKNALSATTNNLKLGSLEPPAAKTFYPLWIRNASSSLFLTEHFGAQLFSANLTLAFGQHIFIHYYQRSSSPSQNGFEEALALNAFIWPF